MVNIYSDLELVKNIVVGAPASLTITSDAVAYQWYVCDDTKHTNSVLLEETSNTLTILYNEPCIKCYYCMLQDSSGTFFTSNTCSVFAKDANNYMAALLADKEALRVTLQQVGANVSETSTFDDLIAAAWAINGTGIQSHRDNAVKIKSIRTLTKAEYDAIIEKEADVLYIVENEEN